MGTKNVFDFRPRGKCRIRYVRASPDNEDVDRAYSLFYISVGTLASIVQTRIKDTLDYLKGHKDMFKREVKYNIKQAEARIDALIGIFKKYTSESNAYTMWLDVTDGIENALGKDITRAFYSLDNYLLKYSSGGDHLLVSHAILAFNLSVLLNNFISRYVDTVIKDNLNIPSSIAPSQEYINTASGVAGSMRNLCEILLPNEKFDTWDGNCLGCKDLALAMEIITSSLVRGENISDACEQALSYGRVNYSEISELGEQDMNFENRGTEWNDTQVAVLYSYFKEHSNKELAALLGRSVSSVATKARQLGLRKSDAYLRKIRTNNLKKKEKNANKS